MEIRRACMEDLSEILRVYECAREYMRRNGNPTQWAGGYPPVERVKADILEGISYVFAEGKILHGVFVFFIGDDPAYVEIDGAWLNDKPYGVIHRIGSDGTVKGIFGKMSDFCKSQMSEIRIDTHNDNHTMQHLLEKHGFRKCGIIHLADGQPRLAYHFTEHEVHGVHRV